jgi:hypothetical protein
MRIVVALVFLGVLGITPAALADVLPAPGQCAEREEGCGGCAQEVCSPPLGPDMAIPRDDLSLPPRDLASPPSDGALDACRERMRTRTRAKGRGLALLSGLSAIAIVAMRRRGRA